MARCCLVMAILLFLVTSLAAASGPAAPRHAASAAAQSAAATQPSASTSTDNRPADDDLASLRADLNRMQSLLDQMEHNLAMVGSGVTPLRHQFELEIEMWRVLTQQMEGRVRRLQAQKNKN